MNKWSLLQPNFVFIGLPADNVFLYFTSLKYSKLECQSLCSNIEHMGREKKIPKSTCQSDSGENREFFRLFPNVKEGKICRNTKLLSKLILELTKRKFQFRIEKKTTKLHLRKQIIV